MRFPAEAAAAGRLVLLGKGEEALRQQAFHELIKAAGIEKDDFDLSTFIGDESSPLDWFHAAGTSPFLSERRTVVVRQVLRFDIEKLGKTDFSQLPEFSRLILVADEENGDDDKQRRLQTAAGKWVKIVESAGGQHYSFESDPKAAKEELKLEVARMGKTMSDQALSNLVEMTGGSFSRGVGELAKLELYVGDQKQIRDSDVRDVVMPSREWNVFKMVDSVFQGNVPEALRQLRILTGSVNKAEDAAFSRILPTIGRHLRLLWQARACVEANVTVPSAVVGGVKVLPSKNSLSKEQPYRIAPVMATAKKLTFKQLELCFGILADTDARLKGSLEGFSALDSLERMLLEMSTVVASKR